VLLFIFQRTRLGRSIRAVAQQQDGATLCGIDVRHVYTLAFAIGSACVGVAGAAVTPFFYVSPTVGDVFNIASFVVVVLGGLVSMGGSLLGGLLLGIAVSIGAAFLPGSFKEVLMFAIFLAVLLFKPTGLLGSKA
jgi:branched-chain amino acid transport system permease protein